MKTVSLIEMFDRKLLELHLLNEILIKRKMVELLRTLYKQFSYQKLN
jgi:hypothetical protein